MSYDALRRGRCSVAGQIYLLTCVTKDRQPVFDDFFCARLLVRELARTEEEGLVDTLAWVVMPDHLHWLVSLRKGDLSGLMQRLKARSAQAINRRAGRQGTLWQRCFHDHAARHEHDLVALARYVVANPVRAGLVRSVRCYPHWDCVWI